MHFEGAEKQATTTLKMRCVTDVFLGAWPKFTEQLLYQTFSDVYEVKPSGVLTRWCF